MERQRGRLDGFSVGVEEKVNCGIVVHSWFRDAFVMFLEVDLKLFEAALSRFCTSAAGGDLSIYLYQRDPECDQERTDKWSPQDGRHRKMKVLITSDITKWKPKMWLFFICSDCSDVEIDTVMRI